MVRLQNKKFSDYRTELGIVASKLFETLSGSKNLVRVVKTGLNKRKLHLKPRCGFRYLSF